jgi:hypothetical protein
MKNFISIGFLVIVALSVRFGLFGRVGLDIYVHDTYYVIPLHIVSFWLLISIASVWSLIAAYKLARHRS